MSYSMSMKFHNCIHETHQEINHKPFHVLQQGHLNIMSTFLLTKNFLTEGKQEFCLFLQKPYNGVTR